MSRIYTSLSRDVLARLITWPLRRIRWKIVMPYVFLTVVLATAGSYLTTRLVTGSLSDRFDNQLAEAGRVVSDSVVRKERDHLATVRTVSFTKGLTVALQAGDREQIESLVKPIAANDHTERIELLGNDGLRLTTLWLADAETVDYQPLPDNDDTSQWNIVKSVLAAKVDDLAQAELTRTSEGDVLYTAAPLSLDGQRVGLVLVGTSLDSIVHQMKIDALADVTVYDLTGKPLVSTFARPDDRRDDASTNDADLVLSPDLASRVTAEHGALREHRTLWGRGYDLMYGPLNVRGQPNALYSAGLPTEFIFSAGAATRTQIAILFGIGMAAVLVMGLFLAHILTQPIRKLVRTTQLVAEGDLTVRSGVKSLDEIGTLATSFDEMTVRLQRQHLSTISALTSAIDARDPSTLGHSVRVGQLAVMLGRKLGMEDKVLARLEIGGYLHDIGKIGIRDAILLKPGGLTTEERNVIEEHPRIGMDILGSVELQEEVIQFVEAHHERLDGSGYPYGLRGDQVPMVARIAAVADMYDALTSQRPYRQPDTPQEALGRLRLDSGGMLDPRVVETLAAILPDWEQRRTSEPALRGFRLPEMPRRRRVTV